MTLLQLDGVGVRYWRGDRPVDALHDVSLELAAGELAAVCGPSRCGKTTLLEVACGLRAPDRGRALVQGLDLAHLNRRQLADVLREQIAFIPMRLGPQSTALTVRRWIGADLMDRASRRQGDRIAAQALQLVGVPDLLDARWASLSDTERARVAIAHGIARRPRALLIDDAAIGLDVLERADLVRLLRGLAERFGIGVLLTAAVEKEVRGLDAYWSLGAGELVGSQQADAPSNVVPLPRDDRRRA
ncbi:ATP-binding cassette domain-containing protein [Patulibacter defluvii]|uniref:ATP-binding cassette domain-containing protein n=1 Tax=Patulibacter defluvii TaxID=3095358 RepID=UPI002A74F06C|nr:ATP-binding cassette domain-containing protein [Patulibacter sp. DM4]